MQCSCKQQVAIKITKIFKPTSYIQVQMIKNLPC
jgi:hypothetical protein